MKIDDTNIAIIKHLRDGRKSVKDIATSLSISENTVRSRVNRLIEAGVLEITGRIDPEAFSGHHVIFVGVKLAVPDLVRKGKEFIKLRGVLSVSVVTGRFDLIVEALLSEEFDLLQFYTEEVSKIEGIQSVETFVVYKGYNLKVPYIL